MSTAAGDVVSEEGEADGSTEGLLLAAAEADGEAFLMEVPSVEQAQSSASARTSGSSLSCFCI